MSRTKDCVSVPSPRPTQKGLQDKHLFYSNSHRAGEPQISPRDGIHGAHPPHPRPASRLWGQTTHCCPALRPSDSHLSSQRPPTRRARASWGSIRPSCSPQGCTGKQGRGNLTGQAPVEGARQRGTPGHGRKDPQEAAAGQAPLLPSRPAAGTARR